MERSSNLPKIPYGAYGREEANPELLIPKPVALTPTHVLPPFAVSLPVPFSTVKTEPRARIMPGRTTAPQFNGFPWLTSEAVCTPVQGIQYISLLPSASLAKPVLHISHKGPDPNLTEVIRKNQAQKGPFIPWEKQGSTPANPACTDPCPEKHLGRHGPPSPTSKQQGPTPRST